MQGGSFCVVFLFLSPLSFFFLFFSASQTAKWMFEHLCGGLMRTLISYSDLPMLPPSILWWGVKGKGLQKSSLKRPAWLHSLGLQAWGFPKKPSGRKVHWEDVQIICGVNKMLLWHNVCQAMLIPTKTWRKTLFLFHVKNKFLVLLITFSCNSSMNHRSKHDGGKEVRKVRKESREGRKRGRGGEMERWREERRTKGRAGMCKERQTGATLVQWMPGNAGVLQTKHALFPGSPPPYALFLF